MNETIKIDRPQVRIDIADSFIELCDLFDNPLLGRKKVFDYLWNKQKHKYPNFTKKEFLTSVKCEFSYFYYVKFASKLDKNKNVIPHGVKIPYYYIKIDLDKLKPHIKNNTVNAFVTEYSRKKKLATKSKVEILTNTNLRDNIFSYKEGFKKIVKFWSAEPNFRDEISKELALYGITIN